MSAQENNVTSNVDEAIKAMQPSLAKGRRPNVQITEKEVTNAKDIPRSHVPTQTEATTVSQRAPLHLSNHAAAERDHTVVSGSDKGAKIVKEVVIGENVFMMSMKYIRKQMRMLENTIVTHQWVMRWMRILIQLLI